MSQNNHALTLAMERHQAGDWEAAEQACLGVLERDHANVDALCLIGEVALAAGKSAVALGFADRAITVDPSRSPSLSIRGRALRALGRLEEAAASFRKALRVSPESAALHADLGLTLQRQDHLGEAMRSFEKSIRLNPLEVTTHLQLAATVHRQRDFRRGWAEYEWRLRTETYAVPFSQIRWEGSAPNGKSILVLGEQGLGDQLQFVRYAALLSERGARVAVCCDPLLERLFRSCPGVERVITREDEPFPDFDAYVWMGSLPGLFDTTADSVPAEIPYLFADPEQTDRWRRLLSRFEGLRIAINWEGNRLNVPGRHRAIPLTAFYPIARLPGVHLFSIQKGSGSDQLADVPDDLRVTNLGQFFVDLWDTAAALEQMDLVITNDTSVAHLAGAMGKPTLLVLPSNPCWRWLDRDDSSWYPSMRLFRQRWEESWENVFLRITSAVEKLPASSGGAVLLQRAG